VSIPPLLTLQQYEKNEDEDEDKHVSTISPQDASLSTYHLQSIVNHMGSRASSGHYTADALREKMLVQQNEEKGDTVNNSDIPSQEIEDGCNSDESHPVWVSYDDDMAYIMTLEKILKKKQESAYMVLYSLD
jgi:Ubiquitin carboxyl-terminal hydrolase